jgi:type VI secretion system protein ImpL
MREDNKLYLIAGAALALWLTVSWYIGSLLQLRGADLWILRGGLAFLGIGGTVGYFWLRSKSSGHSSHSSGDGGGAGDADALFREADSSLLSSGLARKMANLPGLILIGEAGSAKTSTVVHSGLEPELLAGHVFRDNTIVPTRTANIWYAGQTIFLDMGGAQLGDAASRTRLFRRFAPGGFTSALGGGEQAPRAVVLCVDCDNFLQRGAAEALAVKARQFNAWLAELSQQLGIRLPVYVLFTKMDRIPYFHEFAANLTPDEAAQVLGAAMPMQDYRQGGIYAERESERLSAAFQNLYLSLCDHRPDLLGREHDATKLASIYEFPREFRKLRSLLVQFLVDVCRPSQLHTSPFLRGFYFTGVRPYVVRDVVADRPAPRPATKSPFDAGATRIFNPQELAAAQAPILGEPAGVGGRRIAQWVFLNHLFSDVILKDRPALASSSASVKVSFRRRLLLAAGILTALIFVIGWTVSWFGNRRLKNDAVEAAQRIPRVSGAAPSLEALERLDDLRQQLARLTGYKKYGAPMRLRWGLYAGDGLYAGVHRAYFNAFRQMLLSQTQASLVEFLSNPATAQRTGYRPLYDGLKAYLISTSHPDKSTREFLAPVLAEHWQSRTGAEPARAALARKQFEFYADQLLLGNPYPRFATPNENAVVTARHQLAQFAATEAIYQAMLSRAARVNPAFVFNQAYPGSGDVVVNSYPVPGGFTKRGWAFMQNAIRNPEEYFAGEAWVLGPQNLGNIDRVKLQEELRNRYRTDYVQHWREFLKRTSVVRFGSVPDAANKLTKLSGNQSPLLAAICSVAQNTAVEDKEVAAKFQPPPMVTPAGCQERLAGPSNAAYLEGLIRMQAVLQQLAADVRNEGLKAEAISAATGAQVAVRQLATTFPIDKEGQVDTRTQGLLEDPIKYVNTLIAGAGKDAVNGGARALCGQLRALLAKYPFQSRATVQATLAEFDGIFKPGEGALWRLYAESLDKILIRQGSAYVANPGGGMAVSPDFVGFFNRAAAVSAAFYRGDGQQASLNFKLQPVPEQHVQGVNLTIHGRTLSYTGGRPAAQSFVWPGTGPQEVKLRVKFAGGSEFDILSYSGIWAAFQFFLEAERWQTVGNEETMEWTARTSAGPLVIGGRPANVRFILDMGGAPPVFRSGYLGGLNCVSTAVR